MSGSDLLMNGRYDAAAQALAAEYGRRFKDDFVHDRTGHCLSTAYLCLGKAAEAQAILAPLIEKNGKKYEHFYIDSGIASWLLRKYEEALATWKRGQSCGYREMSGGIAIVLLQYLAGVRTNDAAVVTQAKQLMQERLAKAWGIHWPGPIARYVNEELTEDELLALATDPHHHAAIRGEQETQAHFYIGLSHLANGDKPAYRSHLRLCRPPHESKFASESILAPFELRRRK